MKKLLILSAVVIMAGAAAGCNTVEGVGKDIEKAGTSIQNVGKK